MKYTPETTELLVKLYQAKTPTLEISQQLNLPERSVIAKLASLGIYQKKEYRNKNGETPVKKEWYIERLATLLDQNIELLESLEKVNKRVLHLLVEALEPDPKLK